MKKEPEISRGLVGAWVSCDPWASCVEHRVSTCKGQYKVVAIDVDDGKKAEVYNVKWDGTHLHYCLHWKSTGRFSKNSLILLEKDKVGLTYSHTDQEILQKKTRQKKRKA